MHRTFEIFSMNVSHLPAPMYGFLLFILVASFLPHAVLASSIDDALSSASDHVDIVPTNAGVLAFPFFDDFENGLDNWLVSGQDWALVDTDFRSGSHSVTDSPAGNYLPSTDASITLKDAIDLSSSTAPVLTFWQKYFTEANFDFVRVEVSVDGGFNWTNVTSESSRKSTWHHVQLDLSQFSGASIHVRFRLTSNTGSNVDDGWYIDDVEIKELHTEFSPLPFSDDFEGGLDNWLLSGRDWATVDAGNTGDTLAVTDSPMGNYLPNTDASFTLKHPVDLSNTDVPTLRFWHKYDTEEFFDFALVEVSEDRGFTWSQIASFSGAQTTYNLVQLNLSDYKDTPIMIRFRLTANSGGNVGDGWHIFGFDPIILPVELTAFDAFSEHNDAVLQWTTASELNNAGFEVQHRVEGSFQAVAFINGAGTTNEPQNYTHRVRNLDIGSHSFRLKQIDFDGAFSYSPVAEVAIELSASFVLENAYPNPFNPLTTIRFATQRSVPVQLELYNTLGQRVMVLYEGVPAVEEMQEVHLDGSSLPSGTYYIKLVGEGILATRTVTLLK